MITALFWIYTVVLCVLAILGFGLFTYTEGLSAEGLTVFVFHLVSISFLLAIYKGKLALRIYIYFYASLYIFVIFWGSWNILKADHSIFLIMILIYAPLPTWAIYYAKTNQKIKNE